MSRWVPSLQWILHKGHQGKTLQALFVVSFNDVSLFFLIPAPKYVFNHVFNQPRTLGEMIPQTLTCAAHICFIQWIAHTPAIGELFMDQVGPEVKTTGW